MSKLFCEKVLNIECKIYCRPAMSSEKTQTSQNPLFYGRYWKTDKDRGIRYFLHTVVYRLPSYYNGKTTHTIANIEVMAKTKEQEKWVTYKVDEHIAKIFVWEWWLGTTYKYRYSLSRNIFRRTHGAEYSWVPNEIKSQYDDVFDDLINYVYHHPNDYIEQYLDYTVKQLIKSIKYSVNDMLYEITVK